MFRYLKKNQRPRDPIPGWVKWAVLAFIAYAVISNPHRETSSDKKSSDTDVVGAASEKLSQYKNSLSAFGITLQVQDESVGTGAPLICGQEATLAYEAFTEDGKPIGDRRTKDNPYTVQIGSGKTMPALERGVVGMNVGGKRHILARNTLAYGNTRSDIAQNATLRFDVEVLSATPDMAKLDTAAFRIADTSLGGGSTVQCGQSVHLRVVVWNVNGKKLFETKTPVTITAGKSEVAFGIEQGVLGMQRGSTRTLIVPPGLQKPLNGAKAAQSFGLPQAQTVIVDVAAH